MYCNHETLKIFYNTHVQAKAYRQTFSKQHNDLPDNTDVPTSLLDNYRIDITHLYVKTCNPKIKLKYSNDIKKKYAIICTFNGQSWSPQDYGKIKGDKVWFKNIGTKIICLVMYYDNHSLSPASDPFIINEDGKINYLSPSKDRLTDMLLKRKYYYSVRIRKYINDMVGGYFQGANRLDFSDSIRLFTIKTVPEKVETVLINNPTRCRFVRYKTPSNKNGYIAELEFFGGNNSSDTLKLNGNIIGFPEVPISAGTSYNNVFDSNLETYFWAPTISGQSIDHWVGLDLGIPKRITKIRYCPRSDTNFILIGDTYELCYIKVKRNAEKCLPVRD